MAPPGLPVIGRATPVPSPEFMSYLRLFRFMVGRSYTDDFRCNGLQLFGLIDIACLHVTAPTTETIVIIYQFPTGP